MKRTNAKITRFESGNWYIDIVETKDEFNAWLTRKGYGVSSHMFGSPKTQHPNDRPALTVSFDDFCDLVEGNLREYKALYNEDYADEN